MGVLTMRRATTADLPDVLRLLNERVAWLKSRGLPQWGRGFDDTRILPIIARGGTFLADSDGESQPVATITISADGDTDFWTAAELCEPAWYVTKMATSLRFQGHGLGGGMLRWAVDQAAQAGMTWVRLDVWRTNEGLQDWYRSQGWEYLRTVEAPGRNSGALFRRPAVEDSAARRMFAGRPDWLERMLRPSLAPGARVATDRGDGVVLVTQEPTTDQPVAGRVPDFPARIYTVQLDGGAIAFCRDVDVEPACAQGRNGRG